VAWSSDGRILVTASELESMAWDAANFQRLASVPTSTIFRNDRPPLLSMRGRRLDPDGRATVGATLDVTLQKATQFDASVAWFAGNDLIVWKWRREAP
jgi:hypothetical protein